MVAVFKAAITCGNKTLSLAWAKDISSGLRGAATRAWKSNIGVRERLPSWRHFALYNACSAASVPNLHFILLKLSFFELTHKLHVFLLESGVGKRKQIKDPRRVPAQLSQTWRCFSTVVLKFFVFVRGFLKVTTKKKKKRQQYPDSILNTQWHGSAAPARRLSTLLPVRWVLLPGAILMLCCIDCALTCMHSANFIVFYSSINSIQPA